MAEVDYKALAIELSDALLTVRPLGGSELFIRRGDRHFADPAYMKLQIERDRDRMHEWLKESVRHKKARYAAETKLAEALKVLKQILEICEDNAGPEVKHDLALRFVGTVAWSVVGGNRPDAGDARKAQET